jgi:Na+-transporting methylmalonyl-CoA/oxaloacetate decarboxylase gamma subunit
VLAAAVVNCRHWLRANCDNNIDYDSTCNAGAHRRRIVVVVVVVVFFFVIIVVVVLYRSTRFLRREAARSIRADNSHDNEANNARVDQANGRSLHARQDVQALSVVLWAHVERVRRLCRSWSRSFGAVTPGIDCIFIFILCV